MGCGRRGPRLGRGPAFDGGDAVTFPNFDDGAMRRLRESGGISLHQVAQALHADEGAAGVEPVMLSRWDATSVARLEALGVEPRSWTLRRIGRISGSSWARSHVSRA